MESWEGLVDYKPQLKVDGNKVIVEYIGVYDGFVEMCYTREVIYHFENEVEANEYYNKVKFK